MAAQSMTVQGESMQKNNAVAIYFSKEEYIKVEKATTYSVLKGTSLMKVLIKNGLDEMGNSSELIFRFDKNKVIDKTIYKTKVVRLDEKEFEAIVQMSSCIPFSMSHLVKYLIMPQVDEILEKQGWSYKL